ncbi:polysaccharide biosynthesis tyrosine autokinase [Synechococcus sp. 1G10]|uniref:polysaccharide biosynthesis tyrosine autokinase n=1 Tax=Synechococcus sp. 1G10 TaxID=2025605 RepID=UPI001303EAE8|nr:tyrosine-protein kinase [Synechococcus sp. 1G10]
MKPAPTAATIQALPQEADSGGGGLNLQSFVKVLRRRRRLFLITVAGVTLASALVTVHRRITAPVFLGGFTLLLSDPVNEARETGGEGIGSVAQNLSRVDVPTLINVLQSPAVLEPVYLEIAKRYPDSPPPSINVSLLSTGSGQQNILASGVLRVEGKGKDADVVRSALQLTEKAYLDWALTRRREKFTEGIRFLDEQSPVLRAKNNELQAELERFRTTHNVVEPVGEASGLSTEAGSLRNKLLAQEAEQKRLLRVRADVASGRLTTTGFSSGSADSGSEGSSTSVTVGVPNQSKLEELSRLEAQISEAQSTYKPGTPILENLIAARDRLRPELQRKELETIDAALQQYGETIASTRQQINQLDRRFKLQPALLREYEDLQRRLQVSQENLDSYLKSREDFQLEIAQNNAPWRVIAPSTVNSVPVEPTISQGLLQGLLLGLVAGTGVAYLRDRLDHVFHSPSEVRDELKQPLLGHVPFIPLFESVQQQKRFMLSELDSSEVGAAGYQRFYYQEAIRNLYTSLRFLSTDKPVRSVAVTSSVPSEGKSLMLVLLAKTLSELGKRVLVVDMDLRLRQMHNRLGLNNLEGVSNLLTDNSRHWQELVQDVPNYPNWQVLTAGRRPPDPARLLSSERMATLTKELVEQGNYDLVLYDTPPVLGLADATLVAEHLDGILLVVSLNKVGRNLPAEAIRRIQVAGAPLLGVVTNARVAKTTAASATEGYGYGSNYGGRYATNSLDAALDPGTAISYYHNGGESNVQKQSGLAKVVPSRSNLKRWRQGLKRWIDG